MADQLNMNGLNISGPGGPGPAGEGRSSYIPPHMRGKMGGPGPAPGVNGGAWAG